MTAHNAVQLELMKNAIGSVVDEMVLTVVRVAYSAIMKDTMDLSSAFCDRHGQMVAQGLSLPLHLGSVPDAMAAVTSKYGDTLSPGDVVVFNDPYLGGLHLPDIFMFKPIFAGESSLLGYAVVVAHHNDMGGRVPGSSAADSTEIFQEGLRIPLVKLYERDVPNETLIEMIRLNVRTPDIVLGDLHAQVAACRTCETGMLQLVERFGIEALEESFEQLLNYSEREARRAIANIPDGTYSFVDHLDDDGITNGKPLRICVTVKVTGETVSVDFAGTEPQARGAINSTLSFTKSAVYFVIRSLMDADVPNNAGFFRPISVTAPPGTIANLRSPAACAARGATGLRIIDATVGALAAAIPKRVRAAGEGGSTSYSFGGYDQGGRFFLFREAILGAWGGAYERDGVDAVANPAINVRNTPVEVVETQAPLVVEHYGLVTDSGGAGKWRGGMSVERQIRFLGEHATLQLRSDRRDCRPFGLAGGQSGASSDNQLFCEGRWQQLPTKFTHPIKHGDVFRHRTAGAGGYGNPLERDPALVLDDVLSGKVSVEGAARDYGVVVNAATSLVDDKRSSELRRRLSRKSSKS